MAQLFGGSQPTILINSFDHILREEFHNRCLEIGRWVAVGKKKNTIPVGFEPTRANPHSFCTNHSKNAP